MRVRPENIEDHAAIDALLRAAFEQDAEAILVDKLRARGDAVVSLLAESDGRLAGHVMLSRMTTPTGCLGLAPLAVDAACRRQGIAGALVARALNDATKAGWQAVFVLGDPAYYGRFGFTTAAALKFETPYPREYFMAFELVQGALERRVGAAAYAPPFSDLD
jgi:putative acetyltransferase